MRTFGTPKWQIDSTHIECDDAVWNLQRECEKKRHTHTWNKQKQTQTKTDTHKEHFNAIELSPINIQTRVCDQDFDIELIQLNCWFEPFCSSICVLSLFCSVCVFFSLLSVSLLLSVSITFNVHSVIRVNSTYLALLCLLALLTRLHGDFGLNALWNSTTSAQIYCPFAMQKKNTLTNWGNVQLQNL